MNLPPKEVAVMVDMYSVYITVRHVETQEHFILSGNVKSNSFQEAINIVVNDKRKVLSLAEGDEKWN